MLNVTSMSTHESEQPARPKLKGWQIEDAKRLRKLFEERSKLSQAEFGATFGIGTQGAVWQYLRGRRPLNPKAANGFARGLEVTIQDISPTLATQIKTIAAATSSAGDRPQELFEKCLDMNDDEWGQMLDFAEYLRSRRRKKQ